MKNSVRMTKNDLPTFCDEYDDLKYYISENKIYFFNTFYELKGVDLDTFEFYIGWFAKDKNNCYFSGCVFKKADVKTFEVLNWAFAKDKNNVYTNCGILKDADPETFEVMGDGYHKEGHRLHPGGYAKDKDHVYYYVFGGKTMKLKDADLETFVGLETLFGKDKTFVFWNGKKLKNANPKTWKFIKDDKHYSTDGKNIYFANEHVKGADLATFEFFTDKNGFAYARDKNFIYNGSARIGVSRVDWSWDEEEIKAFLGK